MRKILYVMMVVSLAWMSASGKGLKRPSSYYYQRALECIENQEWSDAVDYLDRELNDNPDNGYALAYKAYTYYVNDMYAEALTNINQALKKTPKKDKEYVAWEYSVRAKINRSLDHNDNALADYKRACQTEPGNAALHRNYADLLYLLNHLPESNGEYLKAISLEQGDVYSRTSLARNYSTQGDNTQAKEVIDEVIKLKSDYYPAYEVRAKINYLLGQYDAAVDDVMDAYELSDSEGDCFEFMASLIDSVGTRNLMLEKFKIRQIKKPDMPIWVYCQALTNERLGNYAQSIIDYEAYLRKTPSRVAEMRIANCYSSLMMYDKAIDRANSALTEVTDNVERCYLLSVRGGFYANQGDLNRAIDDVTAALIEYPQYYSLYYLRGRWRLAADDIQGALADISLYQSLSSTNSAYCHLANAQCYDKQGDYTKMNQELELALQADTIDSSREVSYVAYAMQGNASAARPYIDSLLSVASPVDRGGNLFQVACFYSLLNDSTRCLDYMEKAFEQGYDEFGEINVNAKLNNMRNNPRFNDLVDRYKHQFLASQDLAALERLGNDSEDEGSYDESVVEIPFTRVSGGLLKVKCEINGLPLYFYFDTGASDVSISNVEAAFMLKNDYLNSRDIQGKEYYSTASGDIAEGTIINLRKIDLGGVELTDVRASVTHSQNAPLLLGQSILSRLGKIEVDNDRNMIRITHKVKQEDEIKTAGELVPSSPKKATEDRNVKRTPKATQEDEIKTQDEIRTNSELVGDNKDQIVKEDRQVFRSVEQMPQFPGGEAALMDYIESQIRYPEQAAKNDIEGRVVVQFVVDANGDIGEVKIVRSVDPGLDAEAVRVVKLLPKFKPGRHHGKPVSVWYTLPVTFRLPNANK